MVHKVVQIGFHRCGTRSLALLFRNSGYRTLHLHTASADGKLFAAQKMQENVAAGRKIFDGIDKFDYYGDLEYHKEEVRIEGFREFARIDRDYPGTVFLLNLRDKDAWVESRRGHIGGRFMERYKAAYGLSSDAEAEARWRTEWDEHIAALRSHFAAKPGRLVEFRIDADPIETLIAALPAYKLDPAQWGVFDDEAAREKRRERAAARKDKGAGGPSAGAATTMPAAAPRRAATAATANASASDDAAARRAARRASAAAGGASDADAAERMARRAARRAAAGTPATGDDDARQARRAARRAAAGASGDTVDRPAPSGAAIAEPAPAAGGRPKPTPEERAARKARRQARQARAAAGE